MKFTQRLGSVGVLLLFALGFVTVLAGVAPVHAFSNTEVASINAQTGSGSSFTGPFVQVNPQNLMVVMMNCNAGTFVNDQAGHYSWSSSQTISAVHDTANQEWSQDIQKFTGTSGNTMSVWSAITNTTGSVTITVTMTGTVNTCDLFVGEWDTASHYFFAQTAQSYNAVLCTTTTNTMATGACSTAPFNSNSQTLRTPIHTVLIGFASAECGVNPNVAGTSSLQLTGVFAPTPADSLNCASPANGLPSSQYSWVFLNDIQTSQGTLTYNYGTQSDSSSADFFTTTACGSSTCFVWHRGYNFLMLGFSDSGLFTPTENQQGIAGCSAPNPHQVVSVAGTGDFVLAQTTSNGEYLNVFNFVINHTNVNSAFAGEHAIMLRIGVYETVQGGSAFAISAGNPLRQISEQTLILKPGAITQDVFSVNLGIGIVSSAWFAVMISQNSSIGFDFQGTATPSAFNDNYIIVGGSGILPSSFFSFTPTTGHPFLPTECIGVQGVFPLQQFAVTEQNTFIVTSTSITSITTCLSSCSSVTITSTFNVTSTQTQQVNNPNMSALNFWLIPMLIIFVPFLLVMAVFVRAPNVDGETIVGSGLSSISLTGWIGFAWSAFVPIYIPIAFTMLLAVLLWRR